MNVCLADEAPVVRASGQITQRYLDRQEEAVYTASSIPRNKRIVAPETENSMSLDL